MNVALITGLEMPRADPEGPLLCDALGRLGIAAEIQPWRGPVVDWQRYDLLVLMSPWDYSQHVEAFLAWARARADVLVNPVSVVAWTSHKGYLLELARAAGLISTLVQKCALTDFNFCRDHARTAFGGVRLSLSSSGQS